MRFLEINIIVKNLKIISFIMIIIHFLGIIYQLYTQATIFAIIIKISYIIMFLALILTLNKAKKLAPFIGFVLSTLSIILSFIYLDISNILIAIFIVYNSYILFITFRNNNEYKKSKSKQKPKPKQKSNKNLK
jgi:uncharacterized membrane protein YfcA